MFASGCVCEWVCLREGVFASGCVCEWVRLRVGVFASGCVCEWVCLTVGVFVDFFFKLKKTPATLNTPPIRIAASFTSLNGCVFKKGEHLIRPKNEHVMHSL